ncbi:glycosyltransferase family 39 protein [Chloroflexota bacterium]
MSTKGIDEPTILDYVKSKIFFWRGEKIQIPPGEPQDRALSSESPLEVEQQLEIRIEPDPPIEPEPVEPFDFRSLKHLLGPLVLALLAQRFLEPPERFVTIGVILYALAATWLVWGSWRGLWRLPARQVDFHLGWQDISFRPYSLLIAILLGIVAFIAFGGNQFTSINLLLWILSLVFFVHAFWQSGFQGDLGWIRKLRTAWGSFLSDGFRISPWTLLVIAAFGLTFFFRFYMLDQVPGEMFSDHAEKLMDVSDVLDGEYRIFFPRNTGREAVQMYLTATMALIFDTGLSFMSLKLGTALAGLLTLPFIYLTGKEVANRRVGLFAMVFAGIAYWPNVISRVALRFTLYPFFYAPMVYFLVRGLRRRSRNDFILAGVFLGLGMHSYSPYRFVPFVVLAAFGLYLLHKQSKGARKLAVGWLALTSLASLMVFLPLLRYWIAHPSEFSYRAMSRLTGLEQPLPGPAWEIFIKNTWKALMMFFWDNGEIWVHSVTGRPALDMISAALFFIGAVLLVVSYLRKREWLDIFWLVSIPLLMMPSILSLAFPAENPALNRTGAAIVPVFLIVGLALDGLLTALKTSLKAPWGRNIGLGVTALLLVLAVSQNYDLVFNQYKTQFDRSSWNTSELGAVIEQFADTIGNQDNAWVIPYPHWVDTRLVGINAGVDLRDYALWTDQLEISLEKEGSKLFLFKPDDSEALTRLRELYPNGALGLYESEMEGKSFYIFTVPPTE